MGYFAKKGDEREKQSMIAMIDSSIWNLTGFMEIWLVARRCQFVSGVRKPCSKIIHFHHFSHQEHHFTLPEISKNRVGAWYFLEKVCRIDVFFSLGGGFV